MANNGGALGVRWSRSLAALALCGGLAGAQTMAQSALAQFESLLQRLEAAEASAPAGRAPAADLMGQITRARTEVEAHLKAHPNDASALVLSARLDRLEFDLKPTVLIPGQPHAAANDPPGSIQEKLERALALEPELAEAHYWKARMHGRKRALLRDGRIHQDFVDLELALRHAARAVALVPNSGPYRRALALCLVEAQRPLDAIAAIRPVDDGRDPIHLLLRDLESLPVPKGALLSTADSESFAQQQMARGRFNDYPQLRVRFYVVPLPALGIESAFAERWAGVKFEATAPPRKVESGEIRFLQQYLSEQREGHIAAAAPAPGPGQPDSGILLSLIEMRNLPARMRERTPAGLDLAQRVGEVFCYLVIVNYRRVP